MKQNFSKILNVICCIALVYCSIRINGLKNDINILKNNINANNRNIENSISLIYRNVDNRLQEQADILAVKEGSIISADIENLTAVLNYKIIPKEYNPQKTTAEIIINGNKHRMEYKDGSYNLQLDIPLMTETRAESIMLFDGENIRNQKIDRSFSPKYDYLTNVYSNLNWSGSGNIQNNEYVWNISGKIHIDADRKGKPAKIVKAELLQLVNGKEVSRQLLTPTEKPDNHESQAAGSSAHYEEEWAISSLEYNIKQEIHLPKNSTVYLCTDVTDGDGLVHRNYIEGWIIGDNPADNDTADVYYGAEAAEIYDADGNLIYKLSEELYK